MQHHLHEKPPPAPPQISGRAALVRALRWQIARQHIAQDIRHLGRIIRDRQRRRVDFLERVGVFVLVQDGNHENKF